MTTMMGVETNNSRICYFLKNRFTDFDNNREFEAIEFRGKNRFVIVLFSKRPSQDKVSFSLNTARVGIFNQLNTGF